MKNYIIEKIKIREKYKFNIYITSKKGIIPKNSIFNVEIYKPCYDHKLLRENPCYVTDYISSIIDLIDTEDFIIVVDILELNYNNILNDIRLYIDKMISDIYNKDTTVKFTTFYNLSYNVNDFSNDPWDKKEVSLNTLYRDKIPDIINLESDGFIDVNHIFNYQKSIVYTKFSDVLELEKYIICNFMLNYDKYLKNNNIPEWCKKRFIEEIKIKENI